MSDVINKWLNGPYYASTGLEGLQNRQYPPQTAETGIKHDSEKIQVELLSPTALLEVAKVMTFGAKKYGANNWRNGLAWTRILGAALRHLLAFMGGQDKDPETGLSHVAHLACCAMFLLEYEKTHKTLDDRYKKV